MQQIYTNASSSDIAASLGMLNDEAHARMTRQAVSVGSIYIVGDGTPENPLKINVPALASAIVNAMTSANFTAIQNGIAASAGIGAVGGGSIGAAD